MVDPADHGRLARSLAFVLFAVSCGYRSANHPAGGARYAVELGAVRTPASGTALSLLAGAREELAREGALADAQPDATIRIELLDVDESAEGVGITAGAPVARGVTLAVRARATLRDRRGAGRDAGTLEARETVAAEPDPAHGVVASNDAADEAARRLGGRLVRRLLGRVDPGE